MLVTDSAPASRAVIPTMARRVLDYWMRFARPTLMRATIAQRSVLLCCLLILPAVEWFSLVRLGPAAPLLGEVTLPKLVVLGLFLALPFAMRRPWHAVGAPVLLVSCLALWMVIANVSRPTYPDDSLRAALTFALASSSAFVGAYVGAGRQPAHYVRGVTWVLLGMLCLSVASGALERFSLYRLPDGSIADRFAPLWTFFRPEAPLTSPVLGQVNVIHAHTVGSLEDPTVPRVAGFFASSNALADFLVVTFPMVALAVAKRSDTVSMGQRLAFGVLLLATLQVVVWTQSRLALAAIAAEILLIGTLAMLRTGRNQTHPYLRRTRPREVGVAVGLLATLLLVSVFGILSDPTFRSRLNADELLEPDRFPRGHISLLRAAVSMVTASPPNLLVGPGQFQYIAAINDPSSPLHIPFLDPGVGAPHSLYVTFAVAAGLPGLALFVLLVSAVLVQSGRRLSRILPPSPGRSLVRALAIGLFGLMLVGVFDLNPVSFPETVFIFFVLGSIAGCCRNVEKSPAIPNIDVTDS